MKVFDEYRFKDWLDYTVGRDIRKHADWDVPGITEELIDGRVQCAIDDLSPMDLVCYLGEYLTGEGK